ncbi:putative UDP-glucose dehydrogenase Ugd1 [Aspergillus undulatus]|uniref:putative UDP-glucose dehydrogenase Ugd1 n=1 Tax=Aspergillus undulatus TaxID=1810928 RepID=UPI003CCCCA6F
MFFFIPLIAVIAGAALVFGHRRYKAFKEKEPQRVIVKGDTFSECIEEKKREGEKLVRSKVENVRRCCVVGAGRVGAITAIILASRNPEVQFCVVDSRRNLIDEWNSDDIPISEPGLEDIFFDDACLYAHMRGEHDHFIGQKEEEDPLDKLVGPMKRRRRLSNLTFSTNIYAAVASADLIFLCLEMKTTRLGNEGPLNHSYLDPTLKVIACVSIGHKIIVQRTAAPYRVTQYIKSKLESTASPSASLTVLTNPSFTLPGSAVNDMLQPQRVIIGHIYSASTSIESITALKRLYAWVDESRIMTMDAWSAELGRMVSMTVVAQQVASLSAVRMLCEVSEASSGNVAWMLGVPEVGLGLGNGFDCRMFDTELRSELRCLVDFARGNTGTQEVAGFWEGVLRMEEFQYRRCIEDMVKTIDIDMKGKEVIVVDAMEERKKRSILLKALEKTGAEVQLWNGISSKERVSPTAKCIEGGHELLSVGKSLEMACSGCCAVVIQGHCRVDDEEWQRIVGQMEEPKALLTIGDGVDKVKMRQLGFQVL